MEEFLFGMLKGKDFPSNVSKFKLVGNFYFDCEKEKVRNPLCKIGFSYSSLFFQKGSKSYCWRIQFFKRKSLNTISLPGISMVRGEGGSKYKLFSSKLPTTTNKMYDQRRLETVYVFVSAPETDKIHCIIIIETIEKLDYKLRSETSFN